MLHIVSMVVTEAAAGLVLFQVDIWQSLLYPCEQLNCEHAYCRECVSVPSGPVATNM